MTLFRVYRIYSDGRAERISTKRTWGSALDEVALYAMCSNYAEDRGVSAIEVRDVDSNVLRRVKAFTYVPKPEMDAAKERFKSMPPVILDAMKKRAQRRFRQQFNEEPQP